MLSTLRRSSDQEMREMQRSNTSSLASLSITSTKTTMQFSNNVRTLCSRVQSMLRQRRRKQKRALQISAPFDFKREPACLPGISADEIAMLREKAAASCIGIADIESPHAPRSPCPAASLFSHPVRPPIITVHPPHATTSTESL